MKEGLKIFTIFGIDVRLHYSWWPIFILLSWSLSTAFFPAYFPGHQPSTYWLMGMLAALLLFISVLLHEFSHSMVASFNKIRVRSITLFFFGGVASIDAEDMKPTTEFLMAIAGPLFSLVLGGILYLIHQNNVNGIITAITFYLYQLNLLLALFNLVPGYPLDGGRAFRALLHAYYRDLLKATAIASAVGKIFAGFLMAVGIISIFIGTGSGLWLALIGGFLYIMAGLSYNQVQAKKILDGLKVKDLMRKNIPKVSPQMNLSEFVKAYANLEDNVFSVADDQFKGLLDVNLIGPVKLELQKKIKLKQLSIPLRNLAMVKPTDSAYKAFKVINSGKNGLVPVGSNGKLAGVITERSLLNRIAWELKFRGQGRSGNSRVNH